MTKAQVDMVRSRAKARNADAWTNHYPEMGRKTVVHRLAKYLPLTPEAVEAIAKDDEREFGLPTVANVTGGVTTGRTSSLRESIKAQAQEIEGTAVEVPAESAPEPTTSEPEQNATVAPPEKCGSLSDPALGEIEECALAPGHLDVPGSKRQHRANSGSIWPAKKEK
jgi:recombinational DNA repair protein RecT